MSRMFRIPALDRFLGRGEAAVTVPPLDGGLKPNNRLEELPAGISANAPDDMALWQGGVVWSDGCQVMSAAGEILAIEEPITAIAASENILAIASAKGLTFFDASGGDVTPALSADITHTTALAFAPDGTLWFATGSTQLPPAEWRRDLMELNRSGTLGRVLPGGQVDVTKTGLGWPAGIAVRRSGAIVVAEAWLSQLIEFDANGGGKGRVLLDEVPGYPGRLTRRASGGWWLCIFAPRSPLIEFVLREPDYRRAMLAEIEPELWVAPKLSSGENYREPMQGGALKQMGVLKPWAPTLSYGLIVALDANFVPQESMHSRAGGQRHGITGALDINGELWMAVQGNGEVLSTSATDVGGAA
ncbi:hypothetical protein N4R57_17550 [Rhodobacteraceae bacterium D3-12]|nr:hypothetical protein N4R57_17550 [Rhodobacteraceae bacterium D3-12]